MFFSIIFQESLNIHLSLRFAFSTLRLFHWFLSSRMVSLNPLPGNFSVYTNHREFRVHNAGVVPLTSIITFYAWVVVFAYVTWWAMIHLALTTGSVFKPLCQPGFYLRGTILLVELPIANSSDQLILFTEYSVLFSLTFWLQMCSDTVPNPFPKLFIPSKSSKWEYWISHSVSRMFYILHSRVL